MSKKQPNKPAAPATAWFPPVGKLWPGQGIYAGIMRGEKGLPDYHLFISGDPATAHAGIAWGASGQHEAGACSAFDGHANTAALVASKHDHPAAQWAAGLHADGHADWYLPSRRELRLLWVNVPELMAEGWHWSSTQYGARSAWGQDFAGGYQFYYGKAHEGRARAVRRFLIT